MRQGSSHPRSGGWSEVEMRERRKRGGEIPVGIRAQLPVMGSRGAADLPVREHI